MTHFASPVTDRFHVLALATWVKPVEGSPGRFSVRVDPSVIKIYYSGKVSSDGSRFFLSTPMGTLTSYGNNLAALESILLGDGVYVESKLGMRGVRAGAPGAPLTVVNPERAPLKPFSEGVFAAGLKIQLLVQAESVCEDYASIQNNDRTCLDQTSVAVDCCAEQLVCIPTPFATATTFVLIGSCDSGCMFNPSTDILCQATFRAIFRDLDALRRGLTTNKDSGERPPKAPKREHLNEVKVEAKIKREQEEQD